jgi:ABC-type Fe3+-hydroxamate transport system substrate-binding protein
LCLSDSYNREIKLDKEPEKIISLSPGITEMLFLLNAENKLIGISDYCDYPEETQYIRKVGGLQNINIENIISLQPDVVIIGSIIPKNEVDKLEKSGITVIAIKQEEKLEGMLDALKMLGQIVNNERCADSLGLYYKNLLEEFKVQSSYKLPRPSGTPSNFEGDILPSPFSLSPFYLSPFTLSPFTFHPSPFTFHPSPFTLHPFTFHLSPFTLHPSPFTLRKPTVYYAVSFGAAGDYTAPANSHINEIIEYAGGRNIGENLTTWNISREYLFTQNPDIVFISTEDLPYFVKTYPYTLLDAVKEGRVYPIESGWIDVISPRNFWAIELMREKIQETIGLKNSKNGCFVDAMLF